jgi:hypothetical protein
LSALPAAARGKGAPDKDGRSKVESVKREQRSKRARATAKSARDRHQKDRPVAGKQHTKNKNNDKSKKGKAKRRFVKLTSLVATVDGVSVAPDTEPQVGGTRLHRPTEPSADEAQAAGATVPAPSSRRGIFNFLVAALLLASLAAWLIRQMGPLKE